MPFNRLQAKPAKVLSLSNHRIHVESILGQDGKMHLRIAFLAIYPALEVGSGVLLGQHRIDQKTHGDNINMLCGVAKPGDLQPPPMQGRLPPTGAKG